MLVRNAYTGALHEVPDQQLYEVGEPVYDGLGNPVGGIFDDIMGAVKNVVAGPVQAATSLLNPMNAVSAALNPAGATANILGSMIPGLAPGHPAPAAVAPPGMPMAPGIPMAPGMAPSPYFPHFRPPFPLGWQHAPVPYTGLGPKRIYMRCAVWPGPAGLVPSFAANMSPAQQQALMPGMPGPGGGWGGRRHHRGGRRHRR